MIKIHQKQLGYWLIISLVVIYLQVIIGGVTRLTESGLSITDWNVVTGVVPPLNEADWEAAFEKYQATPEYKEINKGMTIDAFQQIFFWEWLHRVWGRVGFLVLLGIFAFFVFTKRLDSQGVKRFLLLLFLYICQGVLGWAMVKSGLVDRPDVSHYRLTAHLLLAIFLFAYILWWVGDLLVPTPSSEWQNAALKLRKLAWIIVVVMVVQIAFGGFMSGLKAAAHYPTWPTMNGEWIPTSLLSMKPVWLNFGEHIPTIQFVHRGLAYFLTMLIVIFWYKSKHIKVKNSFFGKNISLLLVILAIQITLGISVLLTAKVSVVVSLGVAHQACGLLLLSTMLFLAFQLGKKKRVEVSKKEVI